MSAILIKCLFANSSDSKKYYVEVIARDIADGSQVGIERILVGGIQLIILINTILHRMVGSVQRVSGISLMNKVMLQKVYGIMMKMKNTGFTLMRVARCFMDRKIGHFGNGLIKYVMLLMKREECIVIL